MNRKTTQDNEVAMGLIEKALSIDPDFVAGKSYQGVMYSGNEPDKALIIFQEANKLASNTNQIKELMYINYRMGIIYGKRLELEKSLK